MIIKSALLAAILCFGSVTVAGAQMSNPSGEVVSGSQPVTSVLLGWNYIHPAACTGINGYYYIIAAEGGYWFTNDSAALIGLAPACQTGNWVGFHVIDSSGAWDQVYVFPFK